MSSSGISHSSPRKSEQSWLVRDASGYMAATYVSQIVAFGIGVVTKGLLGPEDLGVWTLLLAVLSFLGLLEFGVVQAANKEIAYLISKDDEAMAERMKRVQFTFVAFTSVLGAASLSIYALAFSSANNALVLGLLSVSLMFPINQLHLGQVSVYWANREFGAASLLIIAETLLAGTVGLFLVWQLGLKGQIASYFLILLVKMAALAWYARRTARLQIGFSWDREVLGHLLKIGVPLLLINLSNVLKLSGTVFLLSHIFDTHSVGLYSLALSVQNFIYVIPNAFSVVMFPRFQARYAGSNDKDAALRTYLIKPVIGLSFVLLPMLLSAAFFIVPALIDHFLEDYRGSIAILVVMLPGAFFLSLEHMPAQFLTTTNRLWERVAISLLSLMALMLCVAPVVLLDGSLLHFVASFSAASFLAFVFSFVYSCRLAKGPRSDRWLMPVLVAAFLYLVIVLLGIDYWMPKSSGTWQADLLAAIGKWFVALLLLFPLFSVAERHLGLLAAARSLLGNSR